MNGSEGVHHFLQLPSIITKSMEYHYPAEFIVPTYIPFDIGPIGYTFETEFERQEVEVGLRVEDLFNNILVVGGNSKDRFGTNFRLVYETAMTERANYLVITTNQQWRRLLDLIPEARVFRVVEDLTINPLDVEGGDVNEHAINIAQAFAQVFHLSPLGKEHLLEMVQNLLITPSIFPDLEALRGTIMNLMKEPYHPAKREFSTLFEFLQNIQHGKPSLVFGQSSVPFQTLMQGVTIIEIDLKIQQQIHFIIHCLLAKLLTYGESHPDQHSMVLIDIADVLMPIDGNAYRSSDIERYLLDWLARFQQGNIGLHLGLQFPSRYPKVAMNYFQTILSHRITPWEDLKIISNLLQLLPDRLVHSRERKNNYQEEFLKTLPSNILILKRSDLTNAFPVQLSEQTIFRDTHVWTSQEIQNRINALSPAWNPPDIVPKTVLEINFGTDAHLIQLILFAINDHPKISRQGLLSFLNGDTSVDIDMPTLYFLLNRLVRLNYIIAEEWETRGHIHASYKLTEKGETIYNAYLEKLRVRSQTH